MVTQPLHLTNRLFGNFFQKPCIILRDFRAGKHKLLPNQDAHSVAVFIEAVFLIDAAAPNPEHIKIGIPGTAYQLLIFFIPQAASHTFCRHPVAAPAENFPAVYLHGKSQVISIQNASVDFHPAEAEDSVALLDSILKMLADNILINGLLPIAVGPPELRFLHAEVRQHFLTGNREFLLCHTFALVQDFHFQIAHKFLPERNPECNISGQCRFHCHRFRCRLLFGNQRHIPVNAITREAGCPVPAKMALCLSHKNAVCAENAFVFFLLLCAHSIKYIVQMNRKQVFPIPQQAIHREAINAVHIRSFSNQRAVEEDIGKGVYTLKFYICICVEFVFINYKSFFIYPITFCNPQRLLIVIVKIGVFDNPCLQKVVRHITRHMACDGIFIIF